MSGMLIDSIMGTIDHIYCDNTIHVITEQNHRRNTIVWHAKILTIPYRGSWVVWKRPKTPLRNIKMVPYSTFDIYLLCNWQPVWNCLFEVQTLFPENVFIWSKNSTHLLVQNHFGPVQNFLSFKGPDFFDSWYLQGFERSFLTRAKICRAKVFTYCFM